MSHLIPSIGLGVSFILVVEGRCRFVPFCTYVFVLQWFWCFCLELLDGKSLISGKPLMCWRISTCSSPKGLAWTWICAVLVFKPIAAGLQPGLFLSCYLILLILQLFEGRECKFNKSPVAKLIHKTWPARLICLTIIQRSRFSWLWHPQNTKKKDFLDFAGIRIEIQFCSETHLKDFDLDSKSIGPKDSKIHNHPPTKIRGRSVESSATAMGWTLPASCKHHRGRPAS